MENGGGRIRFSKNKLIFVTRVKMRKIVKYILFELNYSVIENWVKCFLGFLFLLSIKLISENSPSSSRIMKSIVTLVHQIEWNIVVGWKFIMFIILFHYCIYIYILIDNKWIWKMELRKFNIDLHGNNKFHCIWDIKKI